MRIYYRWVVEATKQRWWRRPLLLVLVRLTQPTQQPVSTSLTFGALIGCQQIHVGHGTDPIGADLVVMAAVAAAIAVDQSPVLAGRLRPVAETRLTQTNHDGGQRENGGQRADGHQNGIDDDRSLA